MNKETFDKIADALQQNYEEIGAINNLDGTNLPSYQKIINICDSLMTLLFPGFINDDKIHSKCHMEWVRQKIAPLAEELSREIASSIM